MSEEILSVARVESRITEDRTMDSSNIIHSICGISYFKDQETPINLYILDGEKETLNNTMHSHVYMQMCYVNKGSCRHYVGNRSIIMVKGDIFVIPPFVCHKMERINRNEIEIFECEFMPQFINANLNDLEFNSGIFDFAYLEPFLVAENRVKPRLNLSDSAQVEVEKIMIEINDELLAKRAGYRHMLKADLLRLLVLLGREYAKLDDSEAIDNIIIQKNRKAILNAINYINENYMNNLNLQDISRYSKMSQAYFSRLIKHFTRKTFVEYINEIRIRKSIELLKSTDKLITDICFEVGFNDLTNFNRVFKRMTGVSPREYRCVNPGTKR